MCISLSKQLLCQIQTRRSRGVLRTRLREHRWPVGAAPLGRERVGAVGTRGGRWEPGEALEDSGHLEVHFGSL